MNGNTGTSARKWSASEQALLARAETALEDLGLNYHANVRSQYQAICQHIAEHRWLEASHIAHSIQGEAGSFQRPAIARIAVLLRDILLVPDPENREATIEVLRDGLYFFINLNAEPDSAAIDNLLQGLTAVADKSRLEVSP